MVSAEEESSGISGQYITAVSLSSVEVEEPNATLVSPDVDVVRDKQCSSCTKVKVTS